MKKVALIGVTGFGAHIYRQLLRLHFEGRIDFAAAVVRTPAKCPGQMQELKRHGIRIYPDAESLYADKSIHYDMISIPTGIDSHESMLEAALAYGANVLLEKPLTGTIDSARGMIAMAEASPNWVGVGFQNLYGKDTRQLKKMIQKGVIGKVRKISVIGMWPRPTSYYTRNNWVARFKCGDAWVLDSPANNAFAHYIANAMFWAAEPFWDLAKIKQLQAELYRARDIETFDTCSLRLITENDVELVINLTHCCAVQNHEPLVRITGTKGTIDWQLRAFYRVQLAADEFASNIPVSDAMFDEFDVVADKLEGKAEALLCSPRMAGKHTYAINALHTTGKIVSIPKDAMTIAPADGLHQITNIEEGFQKAWEQGVLLSELNLFPWARKADKVDAPKIETFQLPE